MFKTLITTFKPSPDLMVLREEKIAAIKQGMGNKWLFHHDNHVNKMPTKHNILTKWIASRI